MTDSDPVDDDSFDDDDADIIVAVAKWKGRFRWFKSDRELWVLDYDKWTQAFVDAGYVVPAPEEDERFGIPVMSDEFVDRYFDAMATFEVTKDELGRELIGQVSTATTWWDVEDSFPVVFADFDSKHLCAFYSSGTPLERYVPDGWTSEFRDFITESSGERLPRSERYWIQGDRDLLNELNGPGQNTWQPRWLQ